MDGGQNGVRIGPGFMFLNDSLEGKRKVILFYDNGLLSSSYFCIFNYILFTIIELGPKRPVRH